MLLRLAKTVLGFAALAVFGLIFLEGIYSVARWHRADTSVTHDTYALLFGSKAQNNLPLASKADIEQLIPKMLSAGVGMGNVPYTELATGRAAINEIVPEGCRASRANVAKFMTYIRTDAYNLFDPPSLFYDRSATLDAELQHFIDTYGMPKAEFTGNDKNQRVTLPTVEVPDKVLVAGDSVAAGAMIGDSETISSQLQQQDQGHQYINLGVSGATAGDTICRLGAAAKKYHGHINRLIYVYTENDFDKSLPFGRPGEVVSWLKNYAAAENIQQVTIVFAPYIYNIIPNLTRFKGSKGSVHPYYAEEREELKNLTLSAGFNYLSIADVAAKETKARHTDFAAFALFVDHAHLSPYGVAKLVEQLR